MCVKLSALIKYMLAANKKPVNVYLAGLKPV